MNPKSRLGGLGLPGGAGLPAQWRGQRMLTYEEVASQLAFAATASGLELWDVRHMIDTATCDKEFSCFVSPQTSLNRHGRAAMRFVWDVGYTVEAVYGGNCTLYHDEDAECTHDHLEPKPMIDLEIRFDLGRPPARGSRVCQAGTGVPRRGDPPRQFAGDPRRAGDPARRERHRARSVCRVRLDDGVWQRADRVSRHHGRSARHPPRFAGRETN